MVSRIPVPAAIAAVLEQSLKITSLPVQWGDQDAFGHVNNVVYFRWFESARVDVLEVFQPTLGLNNTGIGPILASIHCHYRRQLYSPDVVHIGSRITRIGRSSLDISHVVCSENQNQVVAEGVSVLVIYDYPSGRPIRIPETLRRQLDAVSAMPQQ